MLKRVLLTLVYGSAAVAFLWFGVSYAGVIEGWVTTTSVALAGVSAGCAGHLAFKRG